VGIISTPINQFRLFRAERHIQNIKNEKALGLLDKLAYNNPTPKQAHRAIQCLRKSPLDSSDHMNTLYALAYRIYASEGATNAQVLESANLIRSLISTKDKLREDQRELFIGLAVSLYGSAIDNITRNSKFYDFRKVGDYLKNASSFFLLLATSRDDHQSRLKSIKAAELSVLYITYSGNPLEIEDLKVLGDLYQMDVSNEQSIELLEIISSALRNKKIIGSSKDPQNNFLSGMTERRHFKPSDSRRGTYYLDRADIPDSVYKLCESIVGADAALILANTVLTDPQNALAESPLATQELTELQKYLAPLAFPGPVAPGSSARDLASSLGGNQGAKKGSLEVVEYPKLKP